MKCRNADPLDPVKEWQEFKTRRESKGKCKGPVNLVNINSRSSLRRVLDARWRTYKSEKKGAPRQEASTRYLEPTHGNERGQGVSSPREQTARKTSFNQNLQHLQRRESRERGVK